MMVMDTNLAALFYIGIIVPTLITIIVFIGFLLCLYRRSIQKKMGRWSNRALPSTPHLLPPNNKSKDRNQDKFDKCSQHSDDSAIDMEEIETSLEDKMGGASGLLLDTRSLGKSHHSYQNEAMQLTTEAEIHNGAIRKGQYPSHEKLNEEIHSQVKIYEKMSDVQRIALKIQQRSQSLKPAEKRLVAAAAHKQFAEMQANSRYTSTSKLVPALAASSNNQLDCSSNYATYPPSWYGGANSDANLDNVYSSHRQSPPGNTWKPNITASCSSNTDDYNSSVESSQV